MPRRPMSGRPSASSRQSVSSLHAALDGAGYDLSKLQTAVVTKAGSPEVFTAVRDLDGYTAKAC
jgi:hypothetical protein